MGMIGLAQSPFGCALTLALPILPHLLVLHEFSELASVRLPCAYATELAAAAGANRLLSP